MCKSETHAPKCQISWINQHGEPTPDDNDAIGFAACMDPQTFGTVKSPFQFFPICAKHAERLKGLQHWKFWSL